MSQMTKRFRISYEKNGGMDNAEIITVEKDFTTTETISALQWAEDWAYSAADKGWYEIQEIEPKCKRGHLARFHVNGRCVPAKGWCSSGCDEHCMDGVNVGT